MKHSPRTVSGRMAVALVLAAALGHGSLAASPQTVIKQGTASNQIENGGFEMPVVAGQRIPFWKAGANCTVTEHADGTFYLSLKNESHETSAVCNQTVEIKPEWKKLKISVRARVPAVVPGTKEKWHDCKLALAIDDVNGKRTYHHPFIWKTPAPEWKEYTKIVDLPKDARKAFFSFAIFNALGSADFDDFVVEPLLTDESGASTENSSVKKK